MDYAIGSMGRRGKVLLQHIHDLWKALKITACGHKYRMHLQVDYKPCLPISLFFERQNLNCNVNITL